MKLSYVVGVITLFLIVNLSGFGQTTIPSNPDQFIKTVSKMVRDVNKTSGNESIERFEPFWTGGTLDTKKQKYFIAQIQMMKKKGLKPVPYYTYLMDQMYYAVNTKSLSQSDLDTLIITNVKVLEQYNAKEINRYFSTTVSFLKDNVIGQSKKHTWTANEGSFRIKFVEFKEEVYEEEEEKTEEEPEFWEDENADGWGDNNGDAFADWGDDGGDDWGTFEDEPESSEESIDSDVGDAALEAIYIEPIQPIIIGAVIEFQNINLDLVTAYDSVSLKKTNGSLLLKDLVFVGDTGSFDWTSAGLSSDVQAHFKKYNFSVEKSNLKAEGVTLEYPGKIEEPVKGIFEFDSYKHSTPKEATYPRFMSYANKVTITDLGENIEYKGGFSLNGHSVFSTSVLAGRCAITVLHNGEKKFHAESKNFIFEDSLLLSPLSSITIYANEDSIYSPGVNLKFDRKTENLQGRKDLGKFKDSPFSDNFHKIEIYSDAIYWNLSDSVINFTMTNAKNERPAFFNSETSFQLVDYIQLKGLYPFHPLQMIISYSKRVKKTSFYASDLAAAYNQNEKTVKFAMINLMQRGYIDYDPRGGHIILKDKATHYVDSHRAKKDFDVISIRSISPPVHNAHLNLSNNILTVEGVDEVRLSDSSDVVLYPRDRKMDILGNRTFKLDGTVTTNSYQFNGRDFTFDYENFSIDLVNIDSIKFTVEVKDSITGRVIGRKTLDNKLSYSSGTLTIDKPDNKSGRINYANFPHFDANKGASVVFTQNEVLGGAYDTTIRYKIPPFDIDSLDSEIDGNVNFDGSFVSGGIFPEFDEKLKVMEDLSFGFDHNTPEEGYPLYDSESIFKGSIKLNKQGIRGSGRIEYLNTIVESNDFVFYSDSVITIGTTSTTTRGKHPLAADSVTYPPMSIEEFEMTWFSKQDSMFLRSFNNPFDFFDGQSALQGTVLITPEGMFADGLMESEGALTISSDIRLKEQSFRGSQAQFEILTEQPAKPAMKSDFVNVEVDFENQVAYFSPDSEGVASNEFPYLQYKTSIEDGTWDIKARTVTMVKPENKDINQSYFFSTRKDQDSVAFNAEKAIYSMDSLTLFVSGVPNILIADAEIIPFENRLEISENAVIRTLQNAEITIDTANKFHHLYNGEIDITSRSNFDGQAIYEYINFDKDSLPIQFNKFELVEEKIDKKTTVTHTVSNGVVLEEDTFFIAPKMLYKGNATMFASRKQLDFEGFIKLDITGVMESPNWLKYKSEREDQDVRIDISDQYSTDGKPLVSGIHFSNAKKDYYSTFLNNKKSVNDKEVMSTTGFLSHNTESGDFEVGELEKLRKERLQGNVLGFNEQAEEFHFQGKCELLNPDLDGMLDMELLLSAKGVNNIRDTSFTLESMAVFNFDIPSQVLEIMGTDLSEKAYIEAAPQSVTFSDTLLLHIANIAGEKDARAYEKIGSLTYQPLTKAGKAFGEGIVLNNLNLKYDRDKRSWYNTSSFGIANTGKKDVNAEINGYLEIHKASTGDRVNLYLEMNEDSWYYFEFTNNTLTTISSNEEYNTYIETKSTMAKNQAKGLYYFALANQSQKSRFLKHFGQDFLDGVEIKDYVAPESDFVEDDDLAEELDEEILDNEDIEDEFDAELDDIEDEFDAELDEAGSDDDAKKKNKKKDKGDKTSTDEGLGDDTDEFDAELNEIEDDFDSELDAVKSEDAQSATEETDNFDAELDENENQIDIDESSKKKDKKKDKVTEQTEVEPESNDEEVDDFDSDLDAVEENSTESDTDSFDDELEEIDDGNNAEEFIEDASDKKKKKKKKNKEEDPSE